MNDLPVLTSTWDLSHSCSSDFLLLILLPIFSSHPTERGVQVSSWVGFWLLAKANTPQVFLMKITFKYPFFFFYCCFCFWAFAKIQIIPAVRRLLLVWDILHLNKSIKKKKLTLKDKREDSSKTSSEIKSLRMFR